MFWCVGQAFYLGNELVRLNTQIEYISGPHLLAAMKARPYWIELDADAPLCFLCCQKPLMHLHVLVSC